MNFTLGYYAIVMIGTCVHLIFDTWTGISYLFTLHLLLICDDVMNRNSIEDFELVKRNYLYSTTIIIPSDFTSQKNFRNPTSRAKVLLWCRHS